MRKLATTAIAIASLSLATACSGDDAATPAQDAASSAAQAAEQAQEQAKEAEATAEASAEAAEAAGTLIATVGEESDPDAYTITLTDESGAEVTELPAGEYEIQVTDHSKIHNFHLMSEGDVEETTPVPETTETTWNVTLEEGDYTFICDPHPGMVGEFTVTA